jgi:hypothetical protein
MSRASAARDFLSKMDMSRYGKYYAQLRRNVRISVEKWPISILAAYEDVEASVPLATAARGGEGRTTGAPAVFNVTTGVPRERRGNGAPSAEVLAKNPCNGCGKFGHWLRECPNSDTNAKDQRQSKEKRGAGVRGADTMLVNVEPQDEGDEDYSTSVFRTMLGRVPKGTKFGPHDIIYDSGAEAHVFRDEFFLERCKSKTEVSTVGVSGEETWARCGALSRFPGNALIVEACPVGILSGILAERLYTIVYDQGKSYTVVVDSDLHIKFDKRPDGFYVCDFSVYADVLRAKFSSTSLVGVATVQSLEADYSKRKIKAAFVARELQRALGWPSRADLITALRVGTIVDCPVTVEDVVRAEAIWGEGVAISKGKTTDPGPTTPKGVSVPQSPRKI